MSELLNNQLISAAVAGNENEVDRLLDRGADIHAEDDDALRWAAGYGHTATVALLLKRGNFTAEAVAAAKARATAGDQSEVVALIDSYQAMLKLSKPRGSSSAAHAALPSTPTPVGRGSRL